MDFGFSDEQQLLRETVAELLTREAPLSVARTMLDGQSGFPSQAWNALAGNGWLGVAVPER